MGGVWILESGGGGWKPQELRCGDVQFNILSFLCAQCVPSQLPLRNLLCELYLCHEALGTVSSLFMSLHFLLLLPLPTAPSFPPHVSPHDSVTHPPPLPSLSLSPLFLLLCVSEWLPCHFLPLSLSLSLSLSLLQPSLFGHFVPPPETGSRDSTVSPHAHHMAY